HLSPLYNNATATTVIDTLSLHDALPISEEYAAEAFREGIVKTLDRVSPGYEDASKKVGRLLNTQRELNKIVGNPNEYSDEIFDRDRKSTRLNSSHVKISYAVFCLKKKI